MTMNNSNSRFVIAITAILTLVTVMRRQCPMFPPLPLPLRCSPPRLGGWSWVERLQVHEV